MGSLALLYIYIYISFWCCRITLMQNCVFTGVSYSSPTLASAMSNLVPAFTFVLAVFFRFYFLCSERVCLIIVMVKVFKDT